jgi:predicted CXXCH cytochrome family protein
MKRLVTLAVLGTSAGLGAVALAMQEGQSVVDTLHNLSASGPGQVRAASEEQVCIFCHTPHNATPIQPLWNRNLPTTAYTVYSSNALDARPGQPTGSSKMCLSCHDGTIALGSVASRDQRIQMAGGITTIPPGSTNLGTDLSDDHPISFRFDSFLASRDPHLADPTTLPNELKLDQNRELQCTTCHDAHDNSFGHFLVMSNQNNAALCRSCHQISTTTIAAHQDCNVCHRAHTAPSGPYLLTGDRITATCLECHDGSHGQAKDIADDLMKFSTHDTNSMVDPEGPPWEHATCVDCHDPHTMHQGTANVPNVPPNFGDVPGVSISGASVETANFAYEVCFRCHAENNAMETPYVQRVIVQTNTRLEFAPNAVSFHPVAAPGKASEVPSLKPPHTETSMIACSDCHASDAGQGGQRLGSAGVHGSSYPPLLAKRYETADYTPESASAYALCYHCHYREGGTGVLNDVSFPHRAHVVDARVPCSACHDAHGVSSLQGGSKNNAHLINFDRAIVQPDPGTGRLEYAAEGRFSGSCFLSCHGVVHSGTSYADGEAVETDVLQLLGR